MNGEVSVIPVMLFSGNVHCPVIRLSYIANCLGSSQHIKKAKDETADHPNFSNQQLWLFLNIGSLAAFTVPIERLHYSVILGHLSCRMGNNPPKSYPPKFIQALHLVEFLTTSSTYRSVTLYDLSWGHGFTPLLPTGRFQRASMWPITLPVLQAPLTESWKTSPLWSSLTCARFFPSASTSGTYSSQSYSRLGFGPQGFIRAF